MEKIMWAFKVRALGMYWQNKKSTDPQTLAHVQYIVCLWRHCGIRVNGASPIPFARKTVARRMVEIASVKEFNIQKKL